MELDVFDCSSDSDSTCLDNPQPTVQLLHVEVRKTSLQGILDADDVLPLQPKDVNAWIQFRRIGCDIGEVEVERYECAFFRAAGIENPDIRCSQ